MSAGRLNTLRGGIIIGVLLTLFWGIGGLFFPQQIHETMTSVTKAPFNSAVQATGSFLGASMLGWAVAGLIALRDPLKNLGLIQTFIALSAIMFLVGLYVNLVVDPADVTAIGWISTILTLIVGVLLIWAYPRGQEAS